MTNNDFTAEFVVEHDHYVLRMRDGGLKEIGSIIYVKRPDDDMDIGVNWFIDFSFSKEGYLRIKRDDELLSDNMIKGDFSSGLATKFNIGICNVSDKTEIILEEVILEIKE